MKTNLSTLIFTSMFLAGLLFLEPVASQNCNCAKNMCCSQWGYCGTTSAYCGKGCQSGPCTKPAPTPPSNNANIASIVTVSFFSAIGEGSEKSCPGRGFYTRDAFLKAITAYPQFGRSGLIADSKREIAAFFAHVGPAWDRQFSSHKGGCNQEGGGVRIEWAHSKTYCDKSNKQYPCNPRKRYYGRGPFQLTWNYNYGQAGKKLGFDGLNDPDIVARDPVVAFKTALWFWMNNIHSGFVAGKGFAYSIRKINGGECNGHMPAAVRARVSYYTSYCKKFGVSPEKNLSC
ncbi:putative chitinase [Helianthus annuus]|uniref:Chitinase n=1 Tax=Helianthus annuus TaxID=4232 RepID=A0A251VDM4_HELAN|nr:putative chitinase [Helianthus annuus]KAJ0594919.1 putative chitinase [Helianthus annuus]KAJ0609963.1 putative chitinase [Helianthus annuus]KAJ0775748.1 putative chitinase [Helianthus annuus]KAJ0938047.1 putative chitinase [Helianthus annuus]